MPQADGKMNNEFALTVIETAMEGGINYWANVRGYNKKKISIKIIEYCEEKQVKHDVTPETIQKAIHRLKRGDVPYLCDELRCSLIGKSYATPEEIDIDASDADLIVQVGLFGEIKYQ